MAASETMAARNILNSFGARNSNRNPETREQFLFLLEFFVHSITGDRLAKLNQMFCVPTSVCFQFLNFNDDSIEVTPVDPMFEPQAGIADDIEYFYSGRSVMFAIAEDVFLNQISEFKVALIVRKKMPDNIKPHVLVGVTSVDLSAQFAELKEELQQCWRNMLPPPKTCEGEYPLVYEGQRVGDIGLYVRMSAFGQTIVTEFEAPPGGTANQSTFLFRGDDEEERRLTYKCRMIDSENVDICRDSSEDFRNTDRCQICLPKERVCLPCGAPSGAVLRANASPACFGNADSQLAIPVSFDPLRGLPEGRPIESSRGPGYPCGKAVVLKVSGLLDAGDYENGRQRPMVTVLPESEAMDSNKTTDPDHDVFVLRIGKKGLVAAGEKSDLQLEMRTPKGPERRPPIRYETREMQTESGNKKGKKKKDKNKKNKKRKKGRK